MVDRVRLTFDVSLEEFNSLYKTQFDGHGILRWLQAELKDNGTYIELGRGTETVIPITTYGIAVHKHFKD